MGEIIGELILNIVFCFPGAGLRWIWHRGKIPYKTLISEDFTYNAGILILFVSIILAILILNYQILDTNSDPSNNYQPTTIKSVAETNYIYFPYHCFLYNWGAPHFCRSANCISFRSDRV